VVAGNTAALICDTGALLGYLVETAPDHRMFRSAIDRARTRYVPGLVLAELQVESRPLIHTRREPGGQEG
jgi:predicted nucleic acid-binding protein